MPESVLIVAPHPDDEAIGCGGMACLHRLRGDTVRVAFLTSGERGIMEMPAETVRSIREAEAAQACHVLGIEHIDFLRLPDHDLDNHIERGREALRAVLESKPPTLIYLPHPDESHPDHAQSLSVVRAALKSWAPGRSLPELRGYEVWSPMTRFGWVEDITEVMRQKLQAVRCYKSQLRSFRYDLAIRGLNAYRGIMAAGSRYAEAFQYLEPTEPIPRPSE